VVTTEVKFCEQLLREAEPFCAECRDGVERLGTDVPDRARLRHEAIRFVVTLLQGIHEFLLDINVRATEKVLRVDAQLHRPVAGEVATRSKVPCEFLMAKSGKIGFTLLERDGAVRIEVTPGSMFSFPVDGAVQAGNIFFDDFFADGGTTIEDPSHEDTDRVASACIDWWQGKGLWKGKKARQEQFAGSKLDMVYMSLAGIRGASAVPRKDIASLLLGSMCVTPREYSSFEFTIADNRKLVISCDYHLATESNAFGVKDNYTPWRNALASKLQSGAVERPLLRAAGEKFAKSAINFITMCAAKGLNVRPANSDMVIRLFSVCKCPSAASRWDPMAQDWQQKDVTYGCSGDKEGRIVWRPSSLTMDIPIQHSDKTDRPSGLLCGTLGACCYKPRHRDAEEDITPSSTTSSRSRATEGSFPSLLTPKTPLPTPLTTPKTPQMPAPRAVAVNTPPKSAAPEPKLRRRLVGPFSPKFRPQDVTLEQDNSLIEEDPTLRNVTVEEEAKAKELFKKLEANQEVLRAAERHRGGESLEAMTVRFSRARPKSTSAAYNLLREDLADREEFLRSGLLTNSAANVLFTGARKLRGFGANVDKDALLVAYCQKLPHTILGRDRESRPVLYRGFHSTTSFNDLFDLGLDLNSLVSYNKWMLERCLEIMGQRGQWMVIMDLSELGVLAFGVSGLRYVRMLMTQDAAHYPERLGQVFVINTPRYMGVFWKRMRYWVDAKTRERVKFYGGEKEWRGPLSEVMDLRLLPENLGGTMKLEPNVGMEADAQRPAASGSTKLARKRTSRQGWIRLLLVWLILAILFVLVKLLEHAPSIGSPVAALAASPVATLSRIPSHSN